MAPPRTSATWTLRLRHSLDLRPCDHGLPRRTARSHVTAGDCIIAACSHFAPLQFSSISMACSSTQ
jgi:hypothetical protein